MSSIPCRVSKETNVQLLRPFSPEEVKGALFEMNPTKAPSYDGPPTLFFQNFQQELGSDMTTICLKLLNEDASIALFNKPIISLIPKTKSPKKVAEFRPISLCTLIYKMIAKCLANRLKGSLDSMISEFQSAFVGGRLTHDNVLVGFEGIHTMRHGCFGNGKKVALKLDMSKEYDRVEWVFVEEVMRSLGYNDQLILKIMRCV